MATLKSKYDKAKKAKVGEECICPSCGSTFIKTNYQQAFCKTKGGTVCKDKYWNTVIPTKRNNTSRISPASRRWLNNPDRVTGHTSEGYRIIGGIAYDEFDDPVYTVTPEDVTHPFDQGDVGDKGHF